MGPLAVINQVLSRIFVAGMRTISRIVLIRIGRIKFNHFGFSISEPSNYLLEQQRSTITNSPLPKVIDLFAPGLPIANQQILTIWRRKLSVSSLWAGPLALIEADPKLTKHRVPLRREQYFDIEGLLDSEPRILALTPQELIKGRQEAVALGINPSLPYVCFCHRPPETNSGNRSYSLSPLETYLPAITMLRNLGYQVIRLGKQRSPLPVEWSGVVDYATLPSRSPLLDVFLTAHCSLYLGDSDGLVNLARSFHRPIVLTNWIPMGLANTAHRNTLLLPKLLAFKDSGALLPLKELFSEEFATMTSTHDYERALVTPVSVSADAIKNAVQEILLRRSGKWIENELASSLQTAFWQLAGDGVLREPVRCRLPSSLLLEYHERGLLDAMP